MHLRSKLLLEAGFQHAFFTRQGGCSPAPFDSLNFSASSGDDPHNVERNFETASSALQVERTHLFCVSQVHGTDIQRVNQTDEVAVVIKTQADALITSSPRVAVGVRIADCVPILVADRNTGIVAAIHAGWRGAVGNIVGKTIARWPNQTADLIAAIGPHISLKSFEVGEEVATQIEQVADGESVIDRNLGHRPHANLRNLIAHQLRKAGVTEIDHVEGCTYLDSDRFFSFRRDGNPSGRMLAAIVAK